MIGAAAARDDARRRRAPRRPRSASALLAWVVGVIWIFPVAWTRLHELQDRAGRLGADAAPRPLVRSATTRSASSTEGTLSLATAFSNSRRSSCSLSTAIVMLLAIPAAYALAIRPVPKWRDVLFFFISTKFLPVVASIFPIYVYAEKWNLIGTRTILVVLYTAMNLPLAVWMTRSFFMEVPRELIEAAEIDGTKLINQLRSVILPIAAPGIAATALLCVIFAWNEYFYAIQLNFAGGSTMPQWVIGQRRHARQLPGQAVGRIRDRLPAGRASPAGWRRSA